MLPRFDAHQALAVMGKEEVTFFAGVPTMYWGLLGALDETVDVERLARNLRVAAAGGAALPVEVHKDFQKQVRGARSSRATGSPRPRRSPASAHGEARCGWARSACRSPAWR